MKKIILCSLLVLYSISLLISQSTIEITKDWVLIKQNARSYFDKRRLLEIDAEILKDIEKKSFSLEVEPFLTELLYDIIVYNKLDSNDNCFKAFDILENKLQDKKHLYYVSADFANYHGPEYPYIIAKIFSSLKNTIKENPEENVIALYKVYELIKTPYIVQSHNGTVRYGSNTVLKFLKDYLIEFKRLLGEGEVSDDPKILDTVLRISAEIGL